MAEDSRVKPLMILCQLDIDAVMAYEQAIEKVDDLEIRTRLVEFRGDHDEHIKNLSDLIRGMGEDPPLRPRAFAKEAAAEEIQTSRGFVTSGMTPVVSIPNSADNTESVLRAMHNNEKLTNKLYEEALNEPKLSDSAREIIQLNREDERKHLEYIEECLRAKSWEERRSA